jgi:hypothetical protein
MDSINFDETGRITKPEAFMGPHGVLVRKNILTIIDYMNKHHSIDLKTIEDNMDAIIPSVLPRIGSYVPHTLAPAPLDIEHFVLDLPTDLYTNDSILARRELNLIVDAIVRLPLENTVIHGGYLSPQDKLYNCSSYEDGFGYLNALQANTLHDTHFVSQMFTIQLTAAALGPHPVARDVMQWFAAINSISRQCKACLFNPEPIYSYAPVNILHYVQDLQDRREILIVGQEGTEIWLTSVSVSEDATMGKDYIAESINCNAVSGLGMFEYIISHMESIGVSVTIC